MNIFKTLFGGKDNNQENKKKEEEKKNFDILKYDGVRALRSGKAAYAAKCFEHALDLADDLECRDYLSQAFTQTGQLAEACEQLQKIAEKKPDNYEVFMRIANVAYMMENYAMMSDACEKAMLIDNTKPAAYYVYAIACHKQSDDSNAKAMLTKAINMKNDYADARLLRAEILFEEKDIDGSDEDASWLMEHQPENENALLIKAKILEVKGQHGKALEMYGKTLDANPFNTEALSERAKTRRAVGDEKGAEEDETALDEIISRQEKSKGDEGIEKKVENAYKALDPYKIFNN